MPLRLLLVPFVNFVESLIDSEIRDRVEKPEIGSVVYCDLCAGFADHSGIYIGNDTIVHLDGSGIIEAVSPLEFMCRLDGFNTAVNIYVSCNDTTPVGLKAAAKRAKKMIGRNRDYNLIFDNCHQFTAGCLTGDFDGNACNFLWMLKDAAGKKIKANSWRQWDFELHELYMKEDGQG